MDTMGDPFEHGMRRSRVDPDKEAAARAVMERSGIIARKPIDRRLLEPTVIPGADGSGLFLAGCGLLLIVVSVLALVCQ